MINQKHFYRRLLTLAFPIALQSLMLALVAACDALMLGRLGEFAQEQMTAVSLATQIQFVQNMFIGAIIGAGAILGAQYFGKHDLHTIQLLFNIMLRFSGLVSVLFFLACEIIPGPLMRIFTHDEVLVDIGAGYLRIAGWSYLMAGVSECYLMVMKFTDHMLASALTSSFAVVLNIVLNAVFIFGYGSIPMMEANGAALATTLSRAAQLVVCFALARQEGYLRPAWREFMDVDYGLSADFRKQCLPLLGGSLFWGVGFTSYTAIIGHMGSDAAAANSIAAVIRDLICCVCNGIGSAAAIMVGNEFGAGKLETGKAYGLKLKNVSWVIGFLSMALVWAVTPLTMNLVRLTDEARSYLTGMMVIMGVYMIGRCVNTVTINGVLDGGGDTIFDMYSLAVSMWGVAIPLALLGAFVFHWPVLMVYACTCVDEVGKIPWVMYRVRKYKWVQDLTRQHPEDGGEYLD